MIINNKEKYYKMIDNAEVVSFDIFDTALVRPFTNPSHLFTYIEKKYSILDFSVKRIEAEKKARSKKKSEITIDDIYREISHVDLDLEIEAEILTVRKNEEIFSLYTYARNKGKKVVFTSDMYLTRFVIESLLNKNGYIEFDKIFLSSEVGKTKNNGDLFDLLFAELNVLPRNVVHIGDNYRCDYIVAKNKGIKAIYYSTPFYSLVSDEKQYINQTRCYETDVFSQLYALYKNRVCFNQLKVDDYYWRLFGYKIAGPLCLSFCSWIKRKVTPDSQLLFVARDGYLLKKTFTSLYGDYCKTEYVVAQRLIKLICDFNPDLVAQYEKKQIESVVEYCIKNSSLKLDSPLEEFVRKNRDEIITLIKRNYADYKKYLKKCVCENKNVCIVDTRTENFSSQSLIEKTLSKKVKGLYWITRDAKKESLFFESYAKEHYNLFLNWQIVEFILSAPTPPIEGVAGDSIVYNKNNFYEDTRISIFKEIEIGVDDFLEDIHKFNLENLEVDEFVIRRYINDFISAANVFDKKNFSSILFSYDINHNESRPLNLFACKGKMPIQQRLYRWLIVHPSIYNFLKNVYIIWRRIIKK